MKNDRMFSAGCGIKVQLTKSHYFLGQITKVLEAPRPNHKSPGSVYLESWTQFESIGESCDHIGVLDRPKWMNKTEEISMESCCPAKKSWWLRPG